MKMLSYWREYVRRMHASGAYEEAVSRYEQALALNPDDAEAQAGLSAATRSLPKKAVQTTQTRRQGIGDAEYASG